MKRWKIAGALTLACGACFVGAHAASADPAAAPADGHKAMSPEEMQKMMEEYRKVNAPGPEHEVLKGLIGEWKVATKIFPGPGAPPIETTGEAEAEPEFDGRFVEMEVKGQIMGQPWNGSYVFGYDRFKKQYSLAIWTNVSTALNVGVGTLDEAGKSLTYTVHMDDVNGKRDNRFVIRFESDVKHVLEAYDTVPGMGEIKVLESTFTRDD